MENFEYLWVDTTSYMAYKGPGGPLNVKKAIEA